MSSIVLPKINFDYISGTTPSATISGQLNCTSPSTPTSSNPCDVFSFQNTSGQGGSSNGTRIFLNLQQYLLDANGNATINHQSYFFIDYEFILDDNYKGYVTITDADSNSRTIYVNGNQFHYQRMQLDTSEKAITIDDYQLVRSVNGIVWNIPTESISANSMWLSQTFVDNNELQLLSFYQNAYNQYPIYKLLDKDCDGAIFYANVSPDDPVTIIIISPNLSNSQWSNYVSITGSTVSNISTSTIKSSFNMQLPDDIGGATKAWYIRRWDITTSSRGAVLVDFTQDDTYFIPIYVGTKSQQQLIGTEFALNWGLSNRLLDYLNTGTSASSSSSSDLDDTNTQFQTDANSLISIEDSFNSTMNSNLDNINPTFNMGSSFLASANWVSTQFNRIVNNTPFSSLITFGLTLGLGLLIIGKIRK